MTTCPALAPPAPTLNFSALLPLAREDTLEGYDLYLGGVAHVNLEALEQAYLAADAAGLHQGALVVFPALIPYLGVVTGRNLTVASEFFSAAAFPVMIQSCRGHYEYDVARARALQGPVAVVGVTHAGDVVQGLVTAVSLGPDGLAVLEIAGQQYALQDFASLGPSSDLM